MPKGGFLYEQRTKAPHREAVARWHAVGPGLHNARGEAINGTKPVSTEKTPYGIKAEFHTTIKGKDGTFHDAKVVVIVQNDNGKTTWRLITLYPGKKDK